MGLGLLFFCPNCASNNGYHSRTHSRYPAGRHVIMRMFQFLAAAAISGLCAVSIAVSTAASTTAFAQESRSGVPAAAVKDVVAQVTDESGGGSASVLLTRQGRRLDLLETDLRDMRGVLETDLRNLKMQITQLGNNASSGETATTAELRDLRDQIERLADAVAMTSRRMERALEMTSDMEFRLLRMEKRMQTLMSLGGDELARAAVQDDTIAAGESGEVSMTRDADTGEISWQMNEAELNRQLEGAAADQPSADLANAADGSPADNTTRAAAGTDAGTDVGTNAGTKGDAGPAPVVAAPPKPEVLPDVSAEEQYNFALGRAMQNDLETAEAAFAEFRQFNKGHPREADALFWLGRIQFLGKKYERAALTFSDFSRIYPDDARLNDTTIWVAESVSRFASPEQACAIYSQLPSVVPEPSERLTETLATLSRAASCGG